MNQRHFIKKYAGFVHHLANPFSRIIYRTHDDYGPIEVSDVGSRRNLNFGTQHLQSSLLKADPTLLMHQYNRAMLLPLLFHSPQHVTILGLGGGCLANSLYHHCPALQIQVIELRAAVIETAYRFFQFPRNSRLNVTHIDARDFLQQATAHHTDIIFSDMYDACECETLQREAEFIAQCHRLLNNDGWLVINYVRGTYLSQKWSDAICHWFTDVRICTIPDGNWVILAGKKTISETPQQIKDRSKSLSKQFGFSFNRSLRKMVSY